MIIKISGLLGRLRGEERMHTVPGVLLPAARRRACWAVPGPVDEPGFFFGEAAVNRARM